MPTCMLKVSSFRWPPSRGGVLASARWDISAVTALFPNLLEEGIGKRGHVGAAGGGGRGGREAAVDGQGRRAHQARGAQARVGLVDPALRREGVQGLVGVRGAGAVVAEEDGQL